ncbi:hypothetical protein T484DRAFT_3374108 [Baffinella frigidus]|nr:hypothetical protein T484DRAFT_3374108 [Cryptophyta sp. CCMP2293]
MGLLKFADETEYVGTWEAGCPDGAGVETYRDGSWYAGGFKDDKRHGMGGYWAVDGFVYMGQWQKGVRHGVGVVGHTNEVMIDKTGSGEKVAIKVEVDLEAMRLVQLVPPLSARAKEMRLDLVRCILRKRFDPSEPTKVKALFAVAFDRGRRVRSTWLDLGALPAHRTLLQDAAYGPSAAQMVALEALEFAREGWAVRQLAVQANKDRMDQEEKRRQLAAKAGLLQ